MAEIDHDHARYDCDAVSKVWEALGITEYTGKHIAEHVAELRAELQQARQSSENERTRLTEFIIGKGEENDRLRAQLQQKDAEIVDWNQRTVAALKLAEEKAIALQQANERVAKLERQLENWRASDD